MSHSLVVLTGQALCDLEMSQCSSYSFENESNITLYRTSNGLSPVGNLNPFLSGTR